MMRKPTTSAATATAAISMMLTVVGCGATIRQQPHDLRNFAELTPGISTVYESTILLGKPYSVTRLGGIGEIVQWVGPAARGLGHVAIVFDRDGKMSFVQHVGGL